jgi:hypothetical protein
MLHNPKLIQQHSPKQVGLMEIGMLKFIQIKVMLEVLMYLHLFLQAPDLPYLVSIQTHH